MKYILFFKLIFAIIIIDSTFQVKGQKVVDYSKVDNIALQIPDSLSKTTVSISNYVNTKFNSQTDKARGIFVWIANNIQYDIENMFAINFYQNREEIIAKVLSTRKGICVHFAELYNDISNRAGIKSYVITGYTKQGGFVDYIPHAWCASLIDSTWFFLDPTWGSGYVQNAKFVKKLNNFYFKIIPDELIKSHIPFDPLWQFLNYPITNQEFYVGKTNINQNKPYFNYIDTLRNYEHSSEIDKLIYSSNRIEQNGVKNSIIFERLQHNKRVIEYYNNKLLMETYNKAIILFNEGIAQLNTFIEYRNKQFSPMKPDNEIKQMVDIADSSLINSRKKLNEIKRPDPNTVNSISQLNRSIDDAMKNLNEQKAFLEKYFKTGKMFRKSLFYKYKWMGIPLN